MADRTFTLEEAQSLLPVLESLLRTAIDGKKLIEAVDTELQELAHRVFLRGGFGERGTHGAPQGGAREGHPAGEGRPRGNRCLRRPGERPRYRTARLSLRSRWPRLYCSAGSWGRRESRTGTIPAKASPAASPSMRRSSRRRKRTSRWPVALGRWSKRFAPGLVA